MKKHISIFIFLFFLIIGIGNIAHAFYYEVQIGYGKEESSTLLQQYQIKKINDFKNLHILTAYASLSEIQKMKQDTRIDFVNYNQNVHIDMPKVEGISVKPAQANSNAYNLIHLQEAQKENITGKGNSICVIDTGVDVNHEALKGKVVGYASFIEENNGKINTTDYMGHGTHVAGIISGVNPKYGMYGIAPDTKIYSAKVFNQNEDSSVSSMIAGIDWCVSKKVNIMNMSFGFPANTSYAALSGLDYALQQSYKKGIISVSSAGNEGDKDKSADNVKYPARFSHVLAVASSNQEGMISNFSNRGPSIFITAPGENIVSAYPNNEYYYMSGTSMASPVVSGIVSLIKEKNPNISNENVVRILKKNSIHKGTWGRNTIYGCGIVQAYPISLSTLKNPPTPATYQSYSLSATSMTIKWNASPDCTAKYNLYINGKKINASLLTGTSYKWNTTNVGKNMQIVIETIDENGLKSTSPSKTISLFYQDVPSNHWAYAAIKEATEKGWMTGTTTLKFEPSKPLTRAEIATIISKLVTKPTTITPSNFKDVPKNHWAYQSISIVSQKKIMGGTAPQTFSPQSYMTREQLSVILHRLLQVPTVKTAKSPFSDMKNPSHWSYASVMTLNQNKTLAGCEKTRFCPTSNITRAEMAAILSRTHQNIQEKN